MKKQIYLVVLMVMSALLVSSILKAQDTISTVGVTFSSSGQHRSKPSTEKADSQKSKAVILPAKGRSVVTKNQQEKRSLWAIFIAGLLGGFAAILMPCIFPMLPLTVSYFTKGADRGSATGKALFYGLSIIVIYVALGLLVTVIFGADALNSMSTNGVFNFFFFLLLVVFGASFLGAFEISLPNSWVNKMDANADKGGLAGIFFMAATLALVSFSCTGPIIGGLLAEASTTGALLGPAVGMFGFALALAIPFAIFAMFPSLMQSLPKSGGWLNSVKVVLGFLELAFSLKFLSNVDLAYHWHWFDREVFLVLWIVIFALTGIYLLGKLTFNHDCPLLYLSVPRLFLAIVVLSFTMYMIPGLWGAPLKSISAFLPPQATQDFDLYNVGGTNNNGISSKAGDSTAHKYSNLFNKPKGFNPFYDYNEGLAYANKVHKPVMIDFTGHACVNCRKMEANIWTDKQVYQTITDKYVLIQLYVDDKTDLETAEQTTTPEGRQIKTIGNKWSYLQTSKFVSNSQPFYVLLDPATQEPLVQPQGADYDPTRYLKYLQSGLEVFEKNL